MQPTVRGSRVLIYSHDTMGLGHLRRCRTLAHALVQQNPDMSVLILSGSQIIGSFDFRARVDFVRVPGVIKLRNGEYTSLSLDIDIEQTVSMRASIIKHTAEIFAPDVFIVDKEPLGLRGECAATLEMLKARGTRLVLGLRDILDEPEFLVPEWERKNVMPALKELYDEIWIYGLPQICNPLEGIRLPSGVDQKITYTGYLRRNAREEHFSQVPDIVENPYILVTPGGGGDGESMVEWVLRAYETRHPQLIPALIVFGPFMAPDFRNDFLERTARLENVEAITFDAEMETLVANAAGVVAMGGYNTFCEILSLDKRALIVPRTQPRMEQHLRASRAQSLGLLRMLENTGNHNPEAMIKALLDLPYQKRPSEVVVPGLLEGLTNVNRLVAPWVQNTDVQSSASKSA